MQRPPWSVHGAFSEHLNLWLALEHSVLHSAWIQDPLPFCPSGSCSSLANQLPQDVTTMSDAGQLPSSSDKRHDEVLRSLLEQHAGDPQKLLSTVVHFLERETAFVANPNEKRQMSGAPQHETDMAAPAEASGIDLGTSGKQVLARHARLARLHLDFI